MGWGGLRYHHREKLWKFTLKSMHFPTVWIPLRPKSWSTNMLLAPWAGLSEVMKNWSTVPMVVYLCLLKFVIFGYCRYALLFILCLSVWRMLPLHDFYKKALPNFDVNFGCLFVWLSEWKIFLLYALVSVKFNQTRGQSNLTKSASRRAHSPVRGHPRGSKVVPLNYWGRVSH